MVAVTGPMLLCLPFNASEAQLRGKAPIFSDANKKQSLGVTFIVSVFVSVFALMVECTMKREMLCRHSAAYLKPVNLTEECLWKVERGMSPG